MNEENLMWEVEIDGKRTAISPDRIKRKFYIVNKFDPDIHPQIAYEELGKMRSIVAVCAKIEIHKDTFYEWCATYPEFKAAVDLGRMIGEAKFEAEAVDNFSNRNFNAVLWQMFGRRVYGYTETRLFQFDGIKEGMTYEQELGIILIRVSQGIITAKEGLEMATIVATKAKTYEQMEAKKLLEDIGRTLGEKK